MGGGGGDRISQSDASFDDDEVSLRARRKYDDVTKLKGVNDLQMTISPGRPAWIPTDGQTDSHTDRQTDRQTPS